jgi:hypothetical protein
MGPALQRAYDTGIKPLVANEITAEQAFERGSQPLRAFMQKNVGEKDLKLFSDMAKEAEPAKPEDLSLRVLAEAVATFGLLLTIFGWPVMASSSRKLLHECAPRRFACLWCAKLRAALTAMVGEVRHQRIHRFEPRRIDHRAAVAARCDEARVAQTIQMECQRVGRQPKADRDVAGRHAIGAGFNQQAKHIEAIVLRQSGENRDSILLFHISMIIETTEGRQVTFQFWLKYKFLGHRDQMIAWRILAETHSLTTTVPMMTSRISETCVQ